MTQDRNIKPVNKLECDVLDLEKKYFNALEQIFKSKSFSNRLQKTADWIEHNYKMLSSWKVENKVRLAAQRIINYEVKDQLTSIIDVYSSAISSDIAYETDDAIILIDSKTISETGNSNDFNSLQLGPNQCSFENKRYMPGSRFPGIPIIFNLPAIDSPSQKPILTFFLMLKFYDDKKNEFRWFDDWGHNAHFSCMPNGVISRFFHNDLITNAKTYAYNTVDIKQKDGSYKTEENFCDRDELPDLSTAIAIQLKQKSGFYFPSNGEIWLSTNKKGGVKYGNVYSFKSCRASYSDLNDRYDSNGTNWNGVSSWTI